MQTENEEWRIAAHHAGESSETAGVGLVDEIVVGDWFHLENLEEGVWWIRIGDARVRVMRAVGAAPVVDVERGTYGEIVGTTSEYQVPASS